MSIHATGSFEPRTWDEKPYDESEGMPRLTRASVAEVLHGDVEADGKIEYLMTYRADGSASFVGQERVVGRVGDRSGSFVLQIGGTFADGTARGNWTVIPGSGTGGLRGLRGEGGFVAQHGQSESQRFTLDYDLA